MQPQPYPQSSAGSVLTVRTLMPNLVAGVICGILNTVLPISFGAMIFSGKFAEYLPRGIGLMLFGTAILSLLTALFTSFPSSIAVTQDSPAAIMAIIASAIAGTVTAATVPLQGYITLIAVIVISSVTTGLSFLFFWRLRLGRLIRYLPYPVLGGFLAGTGYFLAQGGISVSAGEGLSLGRLAYFTQPETLVHWFPAFTFGVALLLLTRFRNHYLVIPAMLAGGMLLFYLVLLVTRTPVDEVLRQGYLLGPFPSGGLWQPPDVALIGQIDWSVILAQAGRIFTIVVVSVVSMLLNISALEVIVKRDIDLNRELQMTGLANIVVGLLGSTPGFTALSESALAFRLGARSRLPGIVVTTLLLIVLLSGTSVLILIPKFILGGVLIFLGLSFLVEWLVDGWSRFRKTDYLTIFVIMAVMIGIGVMEGVTAGLVIAITVFVVDYSRLSFIKHRFSGKSFRSNVEYTPQEESFLTAQGDEIYILELQGFIFFGIADKLLAQVHPRLNSQDTLPLRYLVLDFRQVTGFDISAIVNFLKFKQLAQNRHFQLLFTELSPDLQKSLEKEVFSVDRDETCQVFATMDHGVEWCEKQILRQILETGQIQSPDLDHGALKPATEAENLLERLVQHLLHLAVDHESVQDLVSYFEVLKVPANTRLIQQGHATDGIYMIEAGQVVVLREASDAANGAKPMRLRLLGPGTLLGEISVYSSQVASASVDTTEASTLMFLAIPKLREMEAQHPASALLFHKLMASLASTRLIRATDILDTALH